MANQAPRAQHLCNTTMNIQVQQNSTQQPAIRVSRRTFVTRSQKFIFRVKPSAACLTLIHHPRDGGFYNIHLLDGSTPRQFGETSHYEECRDRRKRPTANVAQTEAATPASRTFGNGSSVYCQHRMLMCDMSTATPDLHDCPYTRISCTTRRNARCAPILHETSTMNHNSSAATWCTT
jgi:hypothetical protein